MVEASKQDPAQKYSRHKNINTLIDHYLKIDDTEVEDMVNNQDYRHKGIVFEQSEPTPQEKLALLREQNKARELELQKFREMKEMKELETNLNKKEVIIKTQH